MKKLIAISIAALGLAVHAGIGATTAWTSNYVQRVVDALPQGTGISAEEARRLLAGVIEQFLQSAIGGGGTGGGGGGIYADDFTTSSNDVTKVYQVVVSNGVPTVVAREYDLRVELGQTPPCLGAKIVSSALPEYPVGTVFGCTADGHLVCKTLADTQGTFEVDDSDEGGEVYWEGSPYTYDSLYVGPGIQVAKWARTPEGRELVGTFTLEPTGLTEDEFRAVADGEPGSTEWLKTARNITSALVLTWYRRTPTLQAKRALMAGGSAGSVTIPLDYRGPGMVDYNELFPPADDDGDGEADWEWSPSMGYPPGSWEDPSNWYTDLPVTATFTETDDQGNTVTFTREIPNDAVLRAIIGNYDIAIPPRPYNYPQLRAKRRFKCAKYGHVWKSCVCSVCGELRGHNIASVDPESPECGRCVNLDTELTYTADGDYRVEETDRECGATGTDYDPSKHGGWHHTGPLGEPDMNSPIVYCSCQCGLFGEDGFVLNHDKQPSGLPPQPYDESTHIVTYICARGMCRHEMIEFKSHEVDPTGEMDASNLEYYNEELHIAHGECRECHAQVDALVEHLWGYYGGGKNKCKCPCMANDGGAVDENGVPTGHLHQWGTAYLINPYDKSRMCEVVECWRCGTGGHQDEAGSISEVEGTGDMNHQIANMTDGRKGTENGDVHWCNCSGFSEAHGISNEDIGVCDGWSMVAPFTQCELGGCGYSVKTGKGDPREGNDSSSTDPSAPPNPGNPNGPGGPVNPPIPPTPPEPDDPDDPDEPPTPGPDDPPGPPPVPPFPPPPEPYNGGGGDSDGVDPNSVTNRWDVVGAPYKPPAGPPPPWYL